jgi:hypothetical protein
METTLNAVLRGLFWDPRSQGDDNRVGTFFK